MDEDAKARLQLGDLQHHPLDAWSWSGGGWGGHINHSDNQPISQACQDQQQNHQHHQQRRQQQQQEQHSQQQQQQLQYHQQQQQLHRHHFQHNPQRQYENQQPINTQNNLSTHHPVHLKHTDRGGNNTDQQAKPVLLDTDGMESKLQVKMSD
jgi:hypothetical protein